MRNNNEVYYHLFEGKHSIAFPPNTHGKVYNGERMKSEVREWLDEHSPTWEIDVLDGAADVDFLFETEEEAAFFRVTWG